MRCGLAILVLSAILGVFCTHVQAIAEPLLELGFGLGFGNNSFKETVSGTTTEHSEQIMAVAFDINARAAWMLGQVGVGAVGLLDYEGGRYSVPSTSYGVTHMRYGVGPTISYTFPNTFRLFAEYFPYLRNEIIWTKTKDVNPLHKGDSFAGTGWGVGMGFMIFGRIFLYAIYRQFKYKEFNLESGKFDVPGTRFTDAQSGNIISGGAFSF